MLFTKASEYALISLIYIAKQESPIDVDTLSNELNIPRSFLAKILQNLAKGGLLRSYKGIKGGFILSKPAEQLSIREIIICAEKKEPLVFECSSKKGCPNHKDETCKIFPMINKLQVKVNDFLDDITLAQIIE